VTPRVSIVIPTYNRASIVRRAIDSVLAQTFDDLEILVVDDGSTDDTRAALAGYPERVRAIHQENGGPAAARNHGMRLARGEYIGFLDSDDAYLPRNVEAHLRRFEECPEAGLVYCGIEILDKDGKRLKDLLPNPEDRGLVLERLIRYNFITLSTVLMRRAAMEFAGEMNPSLWFAEDWYYWLRVASRFPIEFVDEVLVRYQRSAVSLSHGTGLETIAERNMEMFALAFADPDLQPRLAPLRAEAHRRAYANYASMALEELQLSLARRFALRAIAARPAAWGSYPLLAKSCLGAGVLRGMRRLRRGGGAGG
jgi:glycosyltransferase involved in cell wall biosynthesis